MKKVSLTDFSDEVMLTVGDVPYEIVEAYVRQAAIKFCRQTHVVKRDTVLDLWCGVKEYVLPEYDGEAIIAVHKVHRGASGYLKPMRLDGGGIRVELPDRIFLRNAPSVDTYGGMYIEVSTAPTQDACEVDAVLYERHYDVIVNSAIASLLSQPAQTWYNANAALVYESKAQRGTAAVNAERLMGGVIGPAKMRHRRFV